MTPVARAWHRVQVWQILEAAARTIGLTPVAHAWHPSQTDSYASRNASVVDFGRMTPVARAWHRVQVWQILEAAARTIGLTPVAHAWHLSQTR